MNRKHWIFSLAAALLLVLLCGAAALAMPVGAPLYTDEPILEDQAFGED